MILSGLIPQLRNHWLGMFYHLGCVHKTHCVCTVRKWSTKNQINVAENDFSQTLRKTQVLLIFMFVHVFNQSLANTLHVFMFFSSSVNIYSAYLFLDILNQWFVTSLLVCSTCAPVCMNDTNKSGDTHLNPVIVLVQSTVNQVVQKYSLL